MQVKVWDKKSNIERTMPEKAYLILKNRYDFITYLDEAGEPTEGQPKGIQQKKSEKKDAPPVGDRIVVRSPEAIAAKKAELEAQNQKAIQAAAEKFEEQQEATLVKKVINQLQSEPEVKIRKKPGPKPKINA